MAWRLASEGPDASLRESPALRSLSGRVRRAAILEAGPWALAGLALSWAGWAAAFGPREALSPLIPIGLAAALVFAGSLGPRIGSSLARRLSPAILAVGVAFLPLVGLRLFSGQSLTEFALARVEAGAKDVPRKAEAEPPADIPPEQAEKIRAMERAHARMLTISPAAAAGMRSKIQDNILETARGWDEKGQPHLVPAFVRRGLALSKTGDAAGRLARLGERVERRLELEKEGSRALAAGRYTEAIRLYGEACRMRETPCGTGSIAESAAEAVDRRLLWWWVAAAFCALVLLLPLRGPFQGSGESWMEQETVLLRAEALSGRPRAAWARFTAIRKASGANLDPLGLEGIVALYDSLGRIERLPEESAWAVADWKLRGEVWDAAIRRLVDAGSWEAARRGIKGASEGGRTALPADVFLRAWDGDGRVRELKEEACQWVDGQAIIGSVAWLLARSGRRDDALALVDLSVGAVLAMGGGYVFPVYDALGADAELSEIAGRARVLIARLGRALELGMLSRPIKSPVEQEPLVEMWRRRCGEARWTLRPAPEFHPGPAFQVALDVAMRREDVSDVLPLAGRILDERTETRVLLFLAHRGRLADAEAAFDRCRERWSSNARFNLLRYELYLMGGDSRMAERYFRDKILGLEGASQWRKFAFWQELFYEAALVAEFHGFPLLACSILEMIHLEGVEVRDSRRWRARLAGMEGRSPAARAARNPNETIAAEDSPDSTVWSRFERVRLLGRGSWGKVYEAVERATDRRVAVKWLLDGLNVRRRDVERFLEEGRVGMSLDHPNIVAVREIIDDGDDVVLVQELVEGETLEAWMESRRPWGECLKVLGPLCEAVSYAHSKGVVHRDIKPANVLVARAGTVKLADFGVARLLEETLTRRGTVAGTLSYMAPEQLEGRAGPASDAYAVAVIAYELAAGELPFQGAIGTARTRDRLLSLSGSGLSALDPVFARALDREPAARFESEDVFFKALSEVSS